MNYESSIAALRLGMPTLLLLTSHSALTYKSRG